jgi:hypothetical protein
VLQVGVDDGVAAVLVWVAVAVWLVVAVEVAVCVAVAVEVAVAVIVAVAVAVDVAVVVGVGVAPIIPLPRSSTCWGLFCAESVNVRPFFRFTLPTPVGWNATSTSQVSPAGNELPQVSLIFRKGGETTMLVIVTATVVESLVTVTVCGALVRVTISSPKLSLPGESVSLGAFALDAF